MQPVRSSPLVAVSVEDSPTNPHWGATVHLHRVFQDFCLPGCSKQAQAFSLGGKTLCMSPLPSQIFLKRHAKQAHSHAYRHSCSQVSPLPQGFHPGCGTPSPPCYSHGQQRFSLSRVWAHVLSQGPHERARAVRSRRPAQV